MNLLHTWAGVVLGFLLMAIFWTGTLAVFDREIDRWMMPATRIAAPDHDSVLDRVLPGALQLAKSARSPDITLLFPTDRIPTIQMRYRDVAAGTFPLRHFNAQTGELLPDQGTLGGREFFFRFHYSFHLRIWNLGIWLVGLASMAMLALCVSGIVIHRRIFVDFFLLRLKRTQRGALDLHNVTGVIGLPFHLIITFTGLVIFIANYWPNAVDFAGGRQTYFKESVVGYSRPAAAVPATRDTASLDRMVQEATAAWDGANPFYARISHIGDRNSYVEVRRYFEDQVAMVADALFFDAQSGAKLSQFSASPTVTAYRFITGIHWIQFKHWTLRWIYFLLGLVGCVTIATGFLFWVDQRRKRHAALGLQGVAIVESLTIGSVTGIIVATGALFVLNRVLPYGYEARPGIEFWGFFTVWAATFAHASLRHRTQAWYEQCCAIAVLALLAIILNAVTTGDHLFRSLSHRHLWAVAGMDLVMLVTGIIAALAARRLSPRHVSEPAAILA